MRTLEVSLIEWPDGPEAGGPRFRKHGGRVVYAISDLLAWSDGQVRHSTTDPRSTTTVRRGARRA